MNSDSRNPYDIQIKKNELIQYESLAKPNHDASVKLVLPVTPTINNQEVAS